MPDMNHARLAVSSPRVGRRDVLAGAIALILGGLAGGPPALGQCAARTPHGAVSAQQVAAFLRSVEAGDLPAVMAWLEQQPLLARSTDERDRSAYIVARLRAHRDVADALLASGLALDIAEAALAGRWARVEELAGKNPGIMNRAHPIGGNPLYAAAIAGGEQLYRLRSLGADPDGRPAGGSGYTPARAAMDAADPIDAWRAAADLLSNGADVNAAQARGDSVLHGAVRARDLRLTRLAIRKGADLEHQDADGRTAADLAELLEWPEGLSLLARAESVARDHRASRLAYTAERTPFRLQAIPDIPRAQQSQATGLSHFNEARIAELLRDEPRLIHAMSTDAELAVEACAHTGHDGIMRMHLDLGAPLALPTALSLGDLDHARWLLEKDPRLVNERGAHDFPVTWYPPIGGDSIAGMELLAEFGADIDMESVGETALHQAAFRNRPEIAAWLLKNGANPESISYRMEREGRTPLAVAIERESEDVVAVLRAA